MLFIGNIKSVHKIYLEINALFQSDNISHSGTPSPKDLLPRFHRICGHVTLEVWAEDMAQWQST